MDQFERSQPRPESLDAQWYSRFESIGAFQTYEYLDGNKEVREAQKTQFIAGEIENPTLDYPKIDPERLAQDEAALLALKEDILRNEPNELVRQVYRWRINEKIGELRILVAAAKGDMRKFKMYSEFVYGQPSLPVFAYTIKNLRETISSQVSSADTNISRAAEALLAVLPTAELSDTAEYDLPQEHHISQVREQTLRELGPILHIESTIEEDKKYTAEEIRDLFQAALNTLHADGWSIIIDSSSKTGISVDQENKKINIPESRTLAFSKLRTLVAHEVGTHVARRLHGERSRLQLLGLGLDRYERGEEGVATMREQVLQTDDIKHYAGLEGHLAIGLASGVDGTPRNFREVYTILQKYFYFKALSSGKEESHAISPSQTNAWNRAVRTFRGTDCATRGACFTKDIIYREGNIDVWQVIKQNPSELLRFSVGKYDPANERHIWVLNQLGISDTDLTK